MIYIEGHWEEVNTLEDVARVIREYYNEELADRMNELLDELFDSFNSEIQRLSVWDENDWDED
jgi:hypothetical protein